MSAYRRGLAALSFALLAAPLWAGSPATETRALRQSFPQGAETLRLANLCGRVELVAGKGREVVVDATIHAAGSDAAETKRLLDSLRWIEASDRKGRQGWALSYPVDSYRGFAYPRKGQGGSTEWLGDWLGEGRSTLEYRGERVAIYGAPRAGAPVLYADLKVELPEGSDVWLRNGVGSVRGGSLRGTLVIDTASGDVDLVAYDGNLTVDTGSGDVDLGDIASNLSVDTGSGAVRVDALRGTGVIDTGSGDVEVIAFNGSNLSVDTGSGDVRVGGGDATTVDVDTGSGDIRIENVELETFRGDTGSGDVVLRSSLARTREVTVDTGSGEVKIFAGPAASFDLEADQGSGDIVVGYADASYKTRGREIYGARRGDGRTVIRVETGSGDCEIHPQPKS
jgi:hypothetical protein